MSYDIYGNPLKPGHCEVHPGISEEYPCSVCLSELRARAIEQNSRASSRQGAPNEAYTSALQDDLCELRDQLDIIYEAFRRFLDERTSPAFTNLVNVINRGKQMGNKIKTKQAEEAKS